MNLPPTSPHLWTERYESLRRHFLQQRQLLQSEPLGLTVLLQQGLARWMRAWQSDAGLKPVAPACAPSSASLWPLPLTPLWQQELTRLIAQMTLPQLQPVAL